MGTTRQSTLGRKTPASRMGPDVCVLWVIPAAAAMAYPWSLMAFHSTYVAGERIASAFWLTLSFVLPLLGLTLVATETVTAIRLSPAMRRLAYLGIGALPLYVFVGVVSGLLKSHVPERTTWVLAWLAAGLFSIINRAQDTSIETQPRRLRHFHGVIASFLSIFVSFHLFNHLTGLIGPDVHTHIMSIGRRFYRSPVIEPVLVTLFILQIITGVVLVWRWTKEPVDPRRAIQIGSGMYLSCFILAHMNSAFISARLIHRMNTGWAWASGGKTGLIGDAWNIRLVPHYAFGVFFILTHLTCGLRGVLLSHGVRNVVADRLLWIGLGVSGLIATSILAGLCGARV